MGRGRPPASLLAARQGHGPRRPVTRRDESRCRLPAGGGPGPEHRSPVTAAALHGPEPAPVPVPARLIEPRAGRLAAGLGTRTGTRRAPPASPPAAARVSPSKRCRCRREAAGRRGSRSVAEGEKPGEIPGRWGAGAAPGCGERREGRARLRAAPASAIPTRGPGDPGISVACGRPEPRAWGSPTLPAGFSPCPPRKESRGSASTRTGRGEEPGARRGCQEPCSPPRRGGPGAGSPGEARPVKPAHRPRRRRRRLRARRAARGAAAPARGAGPAPSPRGAHGR